MNWRDLEFDWTVWIQNGLFGVYEDKRSILRHMARVSRKGIIISTFHPSMLAERKRWLALHNETGEILHIDATGTTYLHFRPPIEMYNAAMFESLYNESFTKEERKTLKLTIKPIQNMSIFFIIERGGSGEHTGADNSATSKRKVAAKKHS